MQLTTVAKPSAALKLVLEAVATLLQADNPVLAVTWHQVHEILQHAWDETMATLQGVPFAAVAGVTHERLVAIMEDERYDAAAAITEGGEGVRELCDYLALLATRLEAAHAESANRTLATTSFCVFVDGSRTARHACDVALALRRSGRVDICIVDEFPSNPSYSADFVLNDFGQYCRQNHVPKHKVALRSQAVRLTQQLAHQLIELRGAADFVVIGATGTKGPQPVQLGSTALNVVLQSPTSVVLVPPIAEASRTLLSHTFVVAVDVDVAAAELCFHNALKLIKPQDTLHIVHIEPPLAPPAPAHIFQETLSSAYADKLAAAQVQGKVVALPAQKGWTVAEQLQAYVATTRASYLVFGLGDQTKKRMSINNSTVGNVAARLLASPRSSPRRRTSAMGTPTSFDQFAVVDPPDALGFTLIPNTAPVALLTVHNVGSAVITFAIQTKAMYAHRFFADPPRGIVGPGKCATIAIVLKQGSPDPGGRR
ncbi:hypothetical protein ACHHYP_08217 [Achlya hypogyna]|uniref:MSP domain-containing protein n=1 Tax=Achlya hypogyna TaxID=1202772 RepID=A0A1V9ZL63_ACHHY|nr:hypothetical protein ACHHYP_08217 [Achlya hypogyna]